MLSSPVATTGGGKKNMRAVLSVGLGGCGLGVGRVGGRELALSQTLWPMFPRFFSLKAAEDGKEAPENRWTGPGPRRFGIQNPGEKRPPDGARRTGFRATARRRTGPGATEAPKRRATWDGRGRGSKPKLHRSWHVFAVSSFFFFSLFVFWS